MNFNHEELMLMMLYNTGTRLGLIHELRLMQCYLMPDETALRELSEGVIEKLKLLTDAEFAELLRKLENEIPDSSWSADLEAGSDFKEGDARCSVRVFERYSMMGGNRLSLTLTMFQNADSPVRLSAITAGGSQAVFFKVNTLGEESFLDDVKDLLEEILEE